jgi:signal transduction histidine kinase/ActR/RegA family two-component response regulator
MADRAELDRILVENQSLRQRVVDLERRLARFGSHDPDHPTELGTAISEREALLTEAERFAHMGSWIWDVRKNRVVWSDELYRILDYDPETDVASTEAFFARVHPMDIARVREASRRAVETGVSHTVQYRLLLPGKRVRDVLTGSAHLYDDKGVLQRAVGTVLDLTSSQQAAGENRRIRSLLEETQRLTSTGSWEQDRTTDSIEWTPELYNIVGLPRTTPPSPAAFEARIHPDDLDGYRALRERAVETGQVASAYECRILRADEVRKVRFVSGQVFDERGQLVGSRGTVSDITVQSKLEEQLHQSRKMEAIGQLSGGIAHDFNNLLMILFDGVERLRNGEETAQCIEDIEAAAQSAATLTQRLLAFGRKAVLTPKLCELTSVVDEMRELVSRTIGEHITTRFEYAERPLTVRIDPHQVQQVLLNLVVNARDAMPEGGDLLVRVERTFVQANADFELSSGSYAMVLVRDSGSGMDASTQSRIFEPFFTTKGVGRGTGLGLSVVYGAMKQCGGAVIVESEVGAGTTFRLYFPLEKGELVPSERPPAPAPKRQRILLVEDDDEVRRAVHGMLRRAGFETIATNGAEQALAEWERLGGDIHILTTDVVMPGMQGDKLAERLLAEKPTLCVLFITGYADRSLVTEKLAGHAAVLQKPFTSSDLLSALERLQAGADVEPA